MLPGFPTDLFADDSSFRETSSRGKRKHESSESWGSLGGPQTASKRSELFLAGSFVFSSSKQLQRSTHELFLRFRSRINASTGQSNAGFGDVSSADLEQIVHRLSHSELQHAVVTLLQMAKPETRQQFRGHFAEKLSSSCWDSDAEDMNNFGDDQMETSLEEIPSHVTGSEEANLANVIQYPHAASFSILICCFFSSLTFLSFLHVFAAPAASAVLRLDARFSPSDD